MTVTVAMNGMTRCVTGHPIHLTSHPIERVFQTGVRQFQDTIQLPRLSLLNLTAPSSVRTVPVVDVCYGDCHTDEFYTLSHSVSFYNC